MPATEQRKPIRELAAVLIAHWPHVRRGSGWRVEQWNRYAQDTVLPMLQLCWRRLQAPAKWGV
jgi:hypothetical protein